MAAVELDPIFVKALKFLHSRSKDSGTQLKALLDDAIVQRKGLKAPAHSGDMGKSSPGRSKSDDDAKKKDVEKRSADKSIRDSSDPEAKKAKLDSKFQSKDDRDVREKEKEKERTKREKEKKEKEEREAQKLREKVEKERKEKELASSKTEAEISMMVSDEEEPAGQMDAGDFALEMGIACVVCRQFDVSSGNQLVECQECHSLYHQECHKPPVTEEDVSDPRFVWYCSRCTRSLKKMMTQKPTKPKPAPVPANTGKELSVVSSKPVKIDASSKSISQAFRWIDPKQTIVTATEAANLNSTTSKPMMGLAGLAANLHKSKGESKSGNSSRKTDQKGDGNKYSSKSETKSNNGNKSDCLSKCSLSGKSEDKRVDSLKLAIKDEKKSDCGSKSSNKTDDRKGSDISLKSSLSSGKEEKLESVSKPEKKPDVGKSPSHSELSRLDVSFLKSSPPQISTSVTLATPDLPSPSKVNSSTSNKQAVANLSLVTANKRIQMMKKKAQTKPGVDKKLHIK